MQQIALLSQSKLLKDHASDVLVIAQAVSKQLHYHAAPAWAASPWSCIYYPDAASVPASAFRLWLLDDSDAAGALGYHDQDPQGQPYGRVFVKPILDSGGDIMTRSNSVSVTVSHEALEIFGDPQANLWAQMNDGRLLALELCDPVESDSYNVKIGTTTVAVSNFVFPEYFDGAPEGSRFDKMGRLNAPWTMTPSGYQIVMAGGNVSNLWGESYSDSRKAAKQHPAARTARRAGEAKP